MHVMPWNNIERMDVGSSILRLISPLTAELFDPGCLPKRCVPPSISQELAFGSIVCSPGGITRRGFWNRLDKRASKQDIEEIPDEC